MLFPTNLIISVFSLFLLFALPNFAFKSKAPSSENKVPYLEATASKIFCLCKTATYDK